MSVIFFEGVRHHSDITFNRFIGMVAVRSQCVTNMESVLTPKKRIQRNEGQVLMRGDDTSHTGGHRFKSCIVQSYLLEVETHAFLEIKIYLPSWLFCGKL